MILPLSIFAVFYSIRITVIIFNIFKKENCSVFYMQIPFKWHITSKDYTILELQKHLFHLFGTLPHKKFIKHKWILMNYYILTNILLTFKIQNLQKFGQKTTKERHPEYVSIQTTCSLPLSQIQIFKSTASESLKYDFIETPICPLL